jgi:hypothetical protein
MRINSLFLFLFTALVLFSGLFSAILIYNIRRFRPLIPLGEKKLMIYLFLGQLIFLILGLISIILI